MILLKVGGMLGWFGITTTPTFKLSQVDIIVAMAQTPSQTSKWGASLFATLSNQLNDPEFIARHRTKASSFVRDRKLPFHRLCLILIWNFRSALHLDPERFFDQEGDPEAPHPTAFSKARAFLKASAFVDLNDALVATARDHALGDHRWHGLRLLAMDGSTLRLIKGSTEIAAHFGEAECRQGTSPPLARMSYLYEVRSNRKGLTVCHRKGVA
jgi:hypothetical protein